MVTGDSRKKNFHFRGCGWSSKAVNWSKEDEAGITAMNNSCSSQSMVRTNLSTSFCRAKEHKYRKVVTQGFCMSMITKHGKLIMRAS